ncbi:MAG: hypothetical protein DMG57_42265, partial [Acidobacteria bacterium]
DRGYARASLLTQLRTLKIPFLIRGRCNTIVRVDGQRLSLGRLPHRVGHPQRYTNAAYQDSTQEPVDIIVFHDPGFQEPWFLLVAAGSELQLSMADVVALYRQRMHIELTFRDGKTHLGVRGWRLEADPALRLGRLLLALSSAMSWRFCSALVKLRPGCAPIAKFSAPSPDRGPSGVSALSPAAYSPVRWHASPTSCAPN